MKDKDQKYLDSLRHSTAHLLAAAVLELYPDAKLAIGPSIENGFYYDIDFEKVKISESDLPMIEKKMHELIKTWKGFKKDLLSADAAKKHYKNKNPYKNELIDEFSEKGKKEVGFYESVGSVSKAYGGKPYSDLCKGGHVEKPSDEIKHFKLLKLAGAYWRGDEKNPMLTRIYGTAWQTKQELDDYLHMIEEAEKRDHKKIGRELELFMFHETSPGMPYWLPNGVILYNELVSFWRQYHTKKNYKEIVSPILNRKDLYVTSGHYEHYWEEMFVAEGKDNDEYGVKAMNCPNAHVVFASKTRSYKDLPLRLSDTDSLHRNERSGTLNGLLRVREFRQDDAHIYVSEDMIESEYENVLEIVKDFYGIFGIAYSFRLGTRDPENFMGEVKTWDKAEKILKNILEKSGVDYFIKDGDGAFYGPKVDILMNDALGREWQMGTIQLDFQQPARFKLKYTDKDGVEKTPIAIHRVIYGSLERFIGILIENFAGSFPVWISPVQVKILPVSDKHEKYALSVQAELGNSGIRVEVDSSNETLGKKIRNAQNEKVPYMLIVGDKEESENKVALRLRDGQDLGQVSVGKFIERVQDKIQSKSLSL